MKDILLAYPAKKVRDINLPLPLLYLAKALMDAGYRPEIFDGHFDNYKKVDFRKYLYVGISTMTGRQVADALELSGHIRRFFQEVPLIWGGPHPTCLPEQTIQSPYVDFVVRGEGEETLVELAQKLEEKDNSLESIKGLTFIQGGQVISNPARDLIDLNKIAHLPYQLLKMGYYANLEDKFEYLSSKGCPHNCGFCSNAANYGRVWRAKSPEVVIDELEFIIREFHPRRIGFIDANFFVDQKRVEEICWLIQKRGWDIDFYAMIRCDYLAKYDEGFIQLLKETGFNELAFGAESGEERLLNLINKGINLDQIIESVSRLKKFAIKPVISLISGLPTETQADLDRTLNLYDQIMKIHPASMVNGIFIFTPLPATSLEQLIIRQFGYQHPQSLEGWARWHWSHKANIPWVDKKARDKYQTIYYLARFFFIEKLMHSWSYKQKKLRHGSFIILLGSILFNKLFYLPAHLRWKYRFFRLPLEWKLWFKAYQIFKGID